MRFAVVGGGIAGLAAAWELSGRPGAEVTVFEPGRLGGKLQTSLFAGRPVDEGPDAFLIRTPEATRLCAELGVDDLVAPAAGRTLLWSGGQLRPLPEGLVLGVPGRVAPLLRSGLLTPAGAARAALDLVLPRASIGEDVSVGSLVTGRFGRQVTDRLVEPLLGSIHAAPVDELSTAVVAPNILAAARTSRSLLLGMRRALARAPKGGAGPIFLAPRQGMDTLVRALEAALLDRGVKVRPEAVTAVSPGRAEVRVTSGAGGGPGGAEDHDGAESHAYGGADAYDGVVIATPAPIAARLLGDAAPGALAGIGFTSVALLTVAVDRSQWEPPAGHNGLLVGGGPRRLMTACSFYSNKWPDAGGDTGQTILRLSAGRHDDRRVDRLTDDELSERLLDDLSAAVGVAIRPAATRLSRWPGSFPLYRVGHASTVARLGQDLAAGTGGRVGLAGSSYGGAGIPACIRSGRAAAGSVLAATVG